MSRVIQTVSYKGTKKQPLHNVPMHTPAIIWVKQGQKHFKWHDQWIRFHRKNWLLAPANQHLTFVNSPDTQAFYSQQISFLIPPTEAMTAQMAETALLSNRSPQPEMIVTDELSCLFEMLWNMQNQPISEAVKTHFVYAFYQSLLDQNALSTLFPNQNLTTREKLYRYLSESPSNPHTIEEVGRHFAVSKATLTRRLASEGTQYREVLAEVRMNHALMLLQQTQGQCTQLDLALQCGYQSETRFSQRFQQQFGLSPKHYIRTLR